jgi:chromosomal replication initiator protein
MYLAKKLTPKSLPDIGRQFGNRDHTTVIHGIRVVERMIGEDPLFKDKVKTIVSALVSTDDAKYVDKPLPSELLEAA